MNEEMNRSTLSSEAQRTGSKEVSLNQNFHGFQIMTFSVTRYPRNLNGRLGELVMVKGDMKYFLTLEEISGNGTLYLSKDSLSSMLRPDEKGDFPLTRPLARFGLIASSYEEAMEKIHDESLMEGYSFLFTMIHSTSNTVALTKQSIQTERGNTLTL